MARSKPLSLLPMCSARTVYKHWSFFEHRHWMAWAPTHNHHTTHHTNTNTHTHTHTHTHTIDTPTGKDRKTEWKKERTRIFIDYRCSMDEMMNVTKDCG